MAQRPNLSKWRGGRLSIRDFGVSFYGRPRIKRGGGGEFRLEFELSAVPTQLKLTAFPAKTFRIRPLNAPRFAVKSRAAREALESRRDWAAADFHTFLVDVYVLRRHYMGDREIELSAMRNWNPRFAISRWKIHGLHMDVAVRPSPPYSDWVRKNSPPLVWRQVVTHLDRPLDNCRARRSPLDSDSSASGNSGPQELIFLRRLNFD